MPGFPNPLLVGEVFREYSTPWEDLARKYIREVWETTKSFVEQALQFLTDDTVSDAVLRHLLDPFTDTYDALQRKPSDTEMTKLLNKAFAARPDMTEEDIPFLIAMLRVKAEPDMDLVAAKATFHAMEAFYKVFVHKPAIDYLLCSPNFRSPSNFSSITYQISSSVK